MHVDNFQWNYCCFYCFLRWLYFRFVSVRLCIKINRSQLGASNLRCDCKKRYMAVHFTFWCTKNVSFEILSGGIINNTANRPGKKHILLQIFIFHLLQPWVFHATNPLIMAGNKVGFFALFGFNFGKKINKNGSREVKNFTAVRM